MRAVVILCFASATAARVPGSFYPVPTSGLNSSSKLATLDLRFATVDDAYSVMTLQGVLSKKEAVIYRYDPTTSAATWLNELQTTYGLQVETGANLSSLLNTYASLLRGYVLVDLTDNSTNTGVAVAAAVAVVAVTPANEAAAVSAGLPLWMDVRGKDWAWALQTLNATNLTDGFVYSSALTVLQKPARSACCLGDFAIAAGALQWWRDNATMSDALSAGVWESMGWNSSASSAHRQPFVMLGWGPDEIGTVSTASMNGGAVLAAGFASNLDVLSAFDLPSFTQKGTGKAPAPSQPVHTVAFLMTDGDNIAWLMDDFTTSGTWFGSPDRGRVPMGWTLASSLADLAPVVMNYLYREASDGSQPGRPGPDVFVAAASGLGYFYPDSTPDAASLMALANSTNDYMSKAGMRVANLLTQGDGPIPQVLQAYCQQPGIDGLIVYHYDDYSGLRGNISFCSNGKPVIGGRCNLWGDGSKAGHACIKNVTQMVDLLLALPADPTSAGGYSLIPVHAWSHNVTDVLTVMQLLEAAAPGKYQVVTPDVLVQRVAVNIAH